jgi:hypothetical protein
MTAEPKLLFVVIPDAPQGASFQFHPISRSQHPDRYRPSELRDTGEAQTVWLVFFEKILVGLYWKYDEPVPFVFRTADGTVRSLDAGCIKWLLNRKPPEVSLHCDRAGIIEAVTPSPALLSRYQADRETLVASLSKKPAAI